jgi:hypothetical protein
MKTIRHMKFPIRMELDDPFDNLETPILQDFAIIVVGDIGL